MSNLILRMPSSLDIMSTKWALRSYLSSSAAEWSDCSYWSRQRRVSSGDRKATHITVGGSVRGGNRSHHDWSNTATVMRHCDGMQWIGQGISQYMWAQRA